MEKAKLKMEQEAMNIEYTNEQIKDIERKVLNRENGIGLEANYIENEYEKRIEVYNRMLNLVKSKLDSDEEIFVSKINVPYKSGSGAMSIVVYYQGLFFTNKRIFIFNMNFKYEEIESMKIKDINDIAILRDNEELDGVRVEFTNKDRIFIKSYSKDERELTLIIVKYLLDKGIKFSKINKTIEKLFY